LPSSIMDAPLSVPRQLFFPRSCPLLRSCSWLFLGSAALSCFAVPPLSPSIPEYDFDPPYPKRGPPTPSFLFVFCSVILPPGRLFFLKGNNETLFSTQTSPPPKERHSEKKDRLYLRSFPRSRSTPIRFTSPAAPPPVSGLSSSRCNPPQLHSTIFFPLTL